MPRIEIKFDKVSRRLPFDFRGLLAAIAPRPFFTNSPFKDDFDVEGVRQVLPRDPCTNCTTPAKRLQRYPDCGHDFPARAARSGLPLAGRGVAAQTTLKLTTPSQLQRLAKAASRVLSLRLTLTAPGGRMGKYQLRLATQAECGRDSCGICRSDLRTAHRARSSLLEVGLKTKPNETALVSLERKWSWRELDQASTRLAGQYLALGLAPGDRVASLMPNRGALLVHYLACFKAGLVATPLNYRYQAPEIDHALEVSGASLLVAHAERDDVLAASEQVPRLPLGRISYGAEGGAHRHLEELMTRDGPTPDLPPPRPDAPAFIFFTSGSTGKPKGVTHSHDTFGWMVASAIAGLGINAGRRLPAGDVGLSHCRVVALVRRAGRRGLRRDRAIVRRRRIAAAAPQHAAVAAVHAAGPAVRPGARPRSDAGRFPIHPAMRLRRRQDLGGAGARVHGPDGIRHRGVVRHDGNGHVHDQSDRRAESDRFDRPIGAGFRSLDSRRRRRRSALPGRPAGCGSSPPAT